MTSGYPRQRHPPPAFGPLSYPSSPAAPPPRARRRREHSVTGRGPRGRPSPPAAADLSLQGGLRHPRHGAAASPLPLPQVRGAAKRPPGAIVPTERLLAYAAGSADDVVAHLGALAADAVAAAAQDTRLWHRHHLRATLAAELASISAKPKPAGLARDARRVESYLRRHA
jgi:hypothetical protein